MIIIVLLIGCILFKRHNRDKGVSIFLILNEMQNDHNSLFTQGKYFNSYLEFAVSDCQVMKSKFDVMMINPNQSKSVFFVFKMENVQNKLSL